MRMVDWLRGRRLDDELDIAMSELFASAAQPHAPDAGQHARARARVGAGLDAATSHGSRLVRPGLALFGAGGALTSIWGATASHRVAAAVAGAVILLGSGMAAEASGLGPSVRDAVQNAVQGNDDSDDPEVLTHSLHEEANHGAVVEQSDEIGGNLITHVGGSGHLHMRAILEAISAGDPGTIAVTGANGVEALELAADARIQLPAVKTDDPIGALQLLLAESEEPIVGIVEGHCTDNGDDGYACTVTRVTVLGHSKPDAAEANGRPEGAGKPEGVGQGKPETPGKPEGAGKPEGTPPDDED